jgi:hypothetical protein
VLLIFTDGGCLIFTDGGMLVYSRRVFLVLMLHSAPCGVSVSSLFVLFNQADGSENCYETFDQVWVRFPASCITTLEMLLYQKRSWIRQIIWSHFQSRQQFCDGFLDYGMSCFVTFTRSPQYESTRTKFGVQGGRV